MHIVRILVSLLAIIVTCGLFDWYRNQPRDVGRDVPAGKLMSLSFAPFREGESPLQKIFPLPQEIEEDVRQVADLTTSIRTYSSSDGLEVIPALARKYGVTMIQGGWLSSGPKHNRQEMEALITSANTNPDVVKRVIVGNEVLLRGDLDIEHLLAYIREVKAAVKQPVSYADVWSVYLKYPQLFKEVDFITIHILPYWEDEPVAADQAAAHVENIARRMADQAGTAAPGKSILIGESGWPAAGRQRGAALPSIGNEAGYIRELVQIAEKHGFDYNIVEAFNQPWKSKQEGVVGANWGLFSADRLPVFSLTGKITDNPDWFRHYLEATLLLLTIVAMCFRDLQRLSVVRLLLFLSLSQVFAASLVHLPHFLWYTSYNFAQRAYTLLICAANAGLAGLLLRRNLDLLCERPTPAAPAEWLHRLYLAFIALALVQTLALGIDGRYLSFPVEQFAVPTAGIVGLLISTALVRCRLDRQNLGLDYLTGSRAKPDRERWLGHLLRFSAILMIAGETYGFMEGHDFVLAHPEPLAGLPVALGYTLCNGQLLTWLACLIILSLPFPGSRRSAGHRQ